MFNTAQNILKGKLVRMVVLKVELESPWGGHKFIQGCRHLGIWHHFETPFQNAILKRGIHAAFLGVLFKTMGLISKLTSQSSGITLMSLLV